jgi:hypothetical protein
VTLFKHSLRDCEVLQRRICLASCDQPCGDTKRNYSGIEACDVPYDRVGSLSSAQVGAYLEGS